MLLSEGLGAGQHRALAHERAGQQGLGGDGCDVPLVQRRPGRLCVGAAYDVTGAAAVPASGTPSAPASTPSAPAVFSVPMGKTSHDSGTPAVASAGRSVRMTGAKRVIAQAPEKRLAAKATKLTVM